MESKNSVVIFLLIVLIGIGGALVLLRGIDNAVSAGLRPLDVKLTAIEAEQKSIEDKLSTQVNPMAIVAGIQGQLGQIQNKIDSMGNQPQQPQQPPPEDMNRIYNIPVGVSAILGDKNAPVTITEFSDFQCPYCAHFYQAIKDVLAAYPGKVRAVIKNFPLPFHPNSRPAAKLAMAANEQGKFQGMMELLLQNGGDASDDSIKKYAQTLGLDYNKLMADYKNKDGQWEKQIQDDMKLGDAAEVRGTPTFYLNGRKTDARDLASFKAQIDPLLAGGK